MAVREFTDEGGRRWRVWDVVPEKIVPGTKDEDYLADLYQTGWLVFETEAGDEKRRLSPFSARWTELSDGGLRGLLDSAQRIRGPRPERERQRSADGARQAPEVMVTAGAVDADVVDLLVTRTFRYPGGRLWVVCVNVHPPDGGSPTLRFTSGARSLDLRPWPRDWADYPDERLIDLLRRGAPRYDAGPPDDGPGRRWTDPPPSSA